MAVVGPTLKLLVTTTSLALLSNVAILSWADDAAHQTDAQGSLPKLEDNDWKPLWDQLEADGPESEKAAELVDNLKKAFDTHEVPEELYGEKEIIQHLVEARQTFRSESCTDDKMKALNPVKFNNLPGSSSLHAHLLEYKRNFFVNCAELIFGELKAKITREIGDEQRKDPQELINELAATIKHHFEELDRFDVARKITNTDYSPEHLTETLFRFLFKQWTDREPGQRLPLNELYDKHIVEPCKHWVPATERVRGLHEYVDEHYVKWWMWKLFANGHVCKYIQDNNEEILESLRKYEESLIQQQ